jgi:hypothetical protein
MSAHEKSSDPVPLAPLARLARLARLDRPITQLKKKNLHLWLGPWVRHVGRSLIQGGFRELQPHRPLHHLLFCFCDHYEPEWGGASPQVAEARVAFWQANYDRVFGGFRDADGKAPQHSFFFPGEEYRPAYLERLTDLVRAGYGEVELHLHHDADTEQVLEQKIWDYLQLLGGRGHFSRDTSGRMRYGFIHGNWALANAHGTGRDCGVDNELEVLFRTGCYADYTFPSAPHPTQPGIVNQIYWPAGDLTRARSYERGETARVGVRHEDRLLLIQGPLAVALQRGRLLPRIEAAALTAVDPATPERVRTWVRQGICVRGRPEWIFVKVHTHGAPELQAAALLGPQGQALHRTLTTEYNDGVRWSLHYVTAREMYNIACAAMDGYDGDPAAFRNYLLAPPPVLAHTYGHGFGHDQEVSGAPRAQEPRRAMGWQ